KSSCISTLLCPQIIKPQVQSSHNNLSPQVSDLQDNKSYKQNNGFSGPILILQLGTSGFGESKILIHVAANISPKTAHRKRKT
ncbi:hypothetical protein ACJX0J_008176, partial [Zea mays]